MRDESGQVTVIIVGMALLVFAISGLAVDGTRAFLFRRTLQNAADAASLAAASSIDLDRYYASEGRNRRLDPTSARRVAAHLLSLRGTGARSTIEVRGDRIVVVLRDDVATMFLGLVGVDHIPVAVSSAAEPRN